MIFMVLQSLWLILMLKDLIYNAIFIVINRFKLSFTWRLVMLISILNVFVTLLNGIIIMTIIWTKFCSINLIVVYIYFINIIYQNVLLINSKIMASSAHSISTQSKDWFNITNYLANEYSFKARAGNLRIQANLSSKNIIFIDTPAFITFTRSGKLYFLILRIYSLIIQYNK